MMIRKSYIMYKFKSKINFCILNFSFKMFINRILLITGIRADSYLPPLFIIIIIFLINYYNNSKKTLKTENGFINPLEDKSEMKIFV